MWKQRWFKRSATILVTFAAALLLVGSATLYSIPSDIQIFSDETKVLKLPWKEVTIHVVPSYRILPGGYPVGVKMNVKGVLVVGLEEIETEEGTRVNPGLLAGIQIGDSILSIDGIKVDQARDVQTLINDSNAIGKPVLLRVKRKDEILTMTVKPVKSVETSRFQLGVWVRDKTAGIGTLTFYHPETGNFGALGHAITDPDTGSILKVANGELVNAKVVSVKQGRAGEPGEIKGIFYEDDAPFGKLQMNTEFGIFGSTYGTYRNPYYSEPLEIGYQDEIKQGKAYILCTLEQDQIERFEVTIEKINKQSKPNTKSMIIRVTDPRLLAMSGGIVQGMSGSPLIQDGKMIGAVTHVFVNDPERGYAIFIEWMLQQEAQLP